MRADRVDPGIEGRPRAAQRLHAERRHHVGRQEEAPRVLQQQAAGSGHEMRPVEHAEGIFRLQFHGLNSGCLERGRGGLSLALDQDLALADQHQPDVGRWRQVTAGAE